MRFCIFFVVCFLICAINASPTKEQHAFSVKDPIEWRLLQFGPQLFEWVPASLLEELLSREQNFDANQLGALSEHALHVLTDFNRMGPGFIDVTNSYGSFDAVEAPVVKFPSNVTQLKHVKARLGFVNQQNLGRTIEMLSTQFYTRHHKSSFAVAVAQRILEEFRQIVAGSLAERGRITVELFNGTSTKQPSVVVKWPGYDSDVGKEIVVVGAHEDSIASGGIDARAPGADDDASGLACVFEIFRVLIDSGFRPKRSIHFMAFSGEEGGLLGSKDIARQYKRLQLPVVGMLQMEM